MTIDIYFDNSPTKTYYSGQTIIGRVHFHFNTKTTIRKLTLDFKGRSKCSWSESTGSGDNKRTTRYHGKIEYFNHREILLQKPQKFDIIGTHTFNFQFTLPNNLSPSVEEDCGNVRYKVKAKVDIPWGIDPYKKEMITIPSHLNLNDIALQARKHMLIQSHKTVGCLCCTSGELSIRVTGPKSGYAVGETAKFHVELDNESDANVYRVDLRIDKVVTFTALSPRRKERVNKAVVCRGSNRRPITDKTESFDVELEIPATISSTSGPSVVTITYLLKVICAIDGWHTNLKGACPLTIGTIPLVTLPAQPTIPVSPTAPFQSTVPSLFEGSQVQPTAPMPIPVPLINLPPFQPYGSDPSCPPPPYSPPPSYPGNPDYPTAPVFPGLPSSSAMPTDSDPLIPSTSTNLNSSTEPTNPPPPIGFIKS